LTHDLKQTHIRFTQTKSCHLFLDEKILIFVFVVFR
jgi:hypothetical protein